MKPESVVAALITIVALVALAAIGLIIFRLDLDMLYTVILILVIGLVVASIVAASALPIRARKSGGPHEREIIREKHTIDGRRPARPHVLTVPAGGGSGSGIFPELLRAAYLAGQRQPQLFPGGVDEKVEVIEGDVVDVPGEWDGPIRGVDNPATQK